MFVIVVLSARYQGIFEIGKLRIPNGGTLMGLFKHACLYTQKTVPAT